MAADKKAGLNRRKFLKVTTGIAAAGAGVTLPGKGFAAGGKPLATLIDLSRCDGCPGKEIPACVGACKTINRDKIPKIHEPIPNHGLGKLLRTGRKSGRSSTA